MNDSINPNLGVNKISKESASRSAFAYRDSNSQFGFKKQNKSKSLGKLKIGEIMQGEILQTFANGIAKVKLPPGIMNAQLTDNLLAADELVFIVSEVEKGLVLKIHSVSTISKGKERSSDEIIRILNLQNNKFFEKLIEFLRKRRQYIYREESMQMLLLFNRLSNSDYNDISWKVIFKNLLFFIENGIDMNPNLFRKTKYAYISLKYIVNALNNLKNQLNNIFPNTQNIDNIRIDDTKDNLLNKILVQLNSIKDDLNQQNFFLLKKDTFALNIIKLYKVNFDLQNEIKKEINFIAHYINAIEIVRIIQKNARKPYKIRVPYIELNEIKIVDILFDIYGNKTRYVFNLSQKFTVQVEIKSTFHSIIIYSDDENINVNNFIEKIKSILNINNINAAVEIRALKSLNKYPEADTILLKNQTFVV